jgi:SAM-dependent methyltransferase
MKNCQGLNIASREDLHVIDCKSCGYCHLFPLPDADSLRRYYNTDDAEYGSPGALAWCFQQQAHHARGLWNTRYRFEQKLLGGKSPLLDIGAGTGSFVRWWKDHGGEAVGIEPSATARKWAWEHSKVQLIENVASLNYGKSSFQVLHLCLVLEHLLNPAKLLERYLPFLSPGGLVLVVVPHEFNSLQRRLNKRLGHWFVDSRHINYFTPKSLRELLRSLSLTIKDEAVTFPTELWRLLGCNSERAGSVCHLLRLWLERTLGLYSFGLYRYCYRRLGWGRELIFVAQKP